MNVSPMGCNEGFPLHDTDNDDNLRRSEGTSALFIYDRQPPHCDSLFHRAVLRRIAVEQVAQKLLMESMQQSVRSTRKRCAEEGTVFRDDAFVEAHTSSKYSGTRRAKQWLEGGGLQWQYATPLCQVNAPFTDGAAGTKTAIQNQCPPLLPKYYRPNSVAASMDQFLRSVAHFFPLQQSSPAGCGSSSPRAPQRVGWVIFDESLGVHPSEIQQGQLGDCWLLSAIAVLALKQPDLITSLFVDTEANSEGVVGVRLWVDGVWELVLLDFYFPTVHEGRSFRFAANRGRTALWVPLLEKAVAKARGGYHLTVSGSPREALYYLTGMPCVNIPLSGDGHLKDDIFARIASLIDSDGTLCALCGGTNASDAYAAALGLVVNHSYSVLCVAVHPTTHLKLVALRNPWGSSDYKGVVDATLPLPMTNDEGDDSLSTSHPPCDDDDGLLVGSTMQQRDCAGVFWMDFNEFLKAFTSVDACLTRSYKTTYCVASVSLPSFASSSSSCFVPPEDTVRAKLVFSVRKATELHILVVQKAILTSDADEEASPVGRREYADVCVMLLKLLDDGEGWALHAVSESTCDHVNVMCTVVDPGRYAIVPFSVAGVPPLLGGVVVNVLSESSGHLLFPRPDQAEAWKSSSFVSLPTLPSVAAMLAMCVRYSERLGRHRPQQVGEHVRTHVASIGVLYVVMAESLTPTEGYRVSNVEVCLGASFGLMIAAGDISKLATTGSLRNEEVMVAAVGAPRVVNGSFRVSLKTQASVSSRSAKNWDLTSVTKQDIASNTSFGGLFEPFREKCR